MAPERRQYLTAPHQPQHVMSEVILACVSAVRSIVTDAVIDAHTQGEWRSEQQADVQALLALESEQLLAGRRRRSTGMGIALDLSRDGHLALMSRLAPYSIHSEAWAGHTAVYSCSDVGDHAWFALTPSEIEDAGRALVVAGLIFDGVLRAMPDRPERAGINVWQ